MLVDELRARAFDMSRGTASAAREQSVQSFAEASSDGVPHAAHFLIAGVQFPNPL